MEAKILLDGLLDGLYEVTISDADVVNPREYIPAGEFNPHNVRPWAAFDHGFCVGVAFASCDQDALDELADAGKLDRFKLDEEEIDNDYSGDDEKGITRLGNAGEPFDIEGLMLFELQTPAFSLCALLTAAQAGVTA